MRTLPWLGAVTVVVVMVASAFWLSVPSFVLLTLPIHSVERLWYALPEGAASRALYEVLTWTAGIVAALAPAALFFVLARRVGRRPEGAWRWLVGSAVLIALLSAWWHASGWSSGVRYQGMDGIFTNLAYGAVMLLVMAWLAIRGRTRPSPALPILFLLAEFVWVLGFAFPWLGETI